MKKVSKKTKDKNYTDQFGWDIPTHAQELLRRKAQSHAHDRELKRQDRLFEIERAKLDYIDGIAEGQE